MELYGSYTSPFVRHCRVVVLQTALPCRLVETAASASKSPTQRVPFFDDGAVRLTDSTSIVRYLREKAGQPFLPKIEDFDLYLKVNTLMDTTVNLFLLSKDGLTTADSHYLRRQSQRVDSLLSDLNQTAPAAPDMANDAHLRLACYLGWASFRDRVNLTEYPRLQQFLEQSQAHQAFAETTPKG